MLRLSDRAWGVFFLSDIFTIQSGTRLTKSDMRSGKMPFIGATESNNGITNWTSTVNASLDRNVLGVNYNGSVVENFYHGYTCVFSDDVKRLHLKTAVDNKYVLLFFKTIILQQKKKYTYGYKFNENRMSRQKLLIPIDKGNSPDYAFMEAYMKEREEYLIRKYEHFIFECEKTIGGGVKSPILWKSFFLTEIFPKIKRGKRLKRADHISGTMPYVSSSSVINGIDAFISNNNGVRIYVNCLTIANSGSVGSCHYHPYRFVASDHVTSLHNPHLNLYHYIFLAAILSRLSEKYNFNREINDSRISREKVLLPSTNTGLPDYAYMEEYGRQVMTEKYRQYFNYLKSKQ